jgi:hypothetical protein
MCVSAVHIAVCRLYSCALQALKLVPFNAVTCSLPAQHTDRTAEGSRCLMPAGLCFKKADDNTELGALACNKTCDFRVLLRIYDSLIYAICPKSPEII